MAIRGIFISSYIDAARAKLIVDVAREVPIEHITIASDTRAWTLSDEPKTVLVCLLKQKRGIIACHIPPALEQRVGLAIEDGGGLRMFEFGEIIVEAMDDDGAVANSSGVEAVRGLAAHTLRKSECEVTDTSHKNKDDAKETHFLTPGPLLLGTPDAYEHEVRQVESMFGG